MIPLKGEWVYDTERLDLGRPPARVHAVLRRTRADAWLVLLADGKYATVTRDVVEAAWVQLHDVCADLDALDAISAEAESP